LDGAKNKKPSLGSTPNLEPNPNLAFFSTPSKFFFAWKKAQMEQKGKKSNLGVILNLEPTPIWHFFAPCELLFVATH